MIYQRKLSLFLFLILLVSLTGCAKNYVITTNLDETISNSSMVGVGVISDELPPDIAISDRPSAEDIGKLKDYLHDEIEKRGDLNIKCTKGDDGDYEIRGSLVDYKKGSGALRFLIGFGAGSAYLTVNLQFIEKSTEKVLFAGSFKGQVSSGLLSGEDMFRIVARSFTKELEKQIEAQL